MLERFSYDLEMKAREQNRNDKQTEIERFDWFIERIQTRVAFGWEANSHIQVVTPFHYIVFIMSAVALIINNKPAFSQRSEFARFSQMFLSMSCRLVIKCPANYLQYVS